MIAWQEREGQTLDGVFPLLRYLGGGAGSAVFLTEYDETNPRRATIKLIPTGLVEPVSQLAGWETASTLSHPHLMQIFAGGECRIEDEDYVYVVMECADENLSQVLSDRVLTAQEARDMLAPVVDALGYLHGKGFVHGRLKPSNIMAVGEQVKITSDTVHQGDLTADDARSLGVVVREALAPRMPGQDAARLPEPFAEIVRRCLDPDPQRQWSMAEISARLSGRESSAAAPLSAAAKNPWLWRIAVLAAAVLIVALGGLLMRAPRTSPAAAVSAVQPAAPIEKINPVEKSNAVNPAREATADGGILSRVLPDIPQKARNTITGKVTVNVKVSVDPSGNVQAATIERPRSSRYLSDRTVAAARGWKFEPGSGPQEWLLRFELFRDRTTVSPTRLGTK